MSTHHDPVPADSSGDGVPTAADARRMLTDAAHIDQRTPDAVPAPLITFAILCVLGTMSTLGIHLAARVLPDPGFNAPLLITIASMAWVLVAIFVPFLFRRPFRRGLAMRWYICMGAWAILWACGMLFGTTVAGIVLAPAFLVLFMIAVTTEARHARPAKRAVPADRDRSAS